MDSNIIIKNNINYKILYIGLFLLLLSILMLIVFWFSHKILYFQYFIIPLTLLIISIIILNIFIKKVTINSNSIIFYHLIYKKKINIKDIQMIYIHYNLIRIFYNNKKQLDEEYFSYLDEDDIITISRIIKYKLFKGKDNTKNINTFYLLSKHNWEYNKKILDDISNNKVIHELLCEIMAS